MTWRVHLAAVASLALGGAAGLALWNDWGAYVWLADAMAWCG